MRITNKTIEYPYLQNIQDIQNRKMKEEIRISTGKDIVNMSDDPENLVDLKKVSSLIAQNNNYKAIIESALSEIRATSDAIEGISQNLYNIQSQAIDATQIGNSSNLSSIASYIRGMIDDSIRLANSNFGGKLLFSGTKTTPSNSVPSSLTKDNLPFEIVKLPPTASNPSGLKVVFSGNNEDRIINKDSQSTEIINIKSTEAFGANSTELFENLIKIYNIINFKADGKVRSVTDPMSNSEQNTLNQFQKDISNMNDVLNNVNGKAGGKINRLTLVSDQMTEENIRLNEIKSFKGDADVAKAAMNLKQDEAALQYSLQIGARTIQNSLFDFLR